jgi:transcriptional regulator with XRE-family HTH domain
VAKTDAPKSTIGEFIRAQRRLAKLSLRQLAQTAKVSNAYLSQVERGIYKPSAKVLKHVAEALQVSAETLYARAGFLDEDDEERKEPGVEQAIRLDPRLSEDQKETMLRVYRGFAGPATDTTP